MERPGRAPSNDSKVNFQDFNSHCPTVVALTLYLSTSRLVFLSFPKRWTLLNPIEPFRSIEQDRSQSFSL